MTEQHNNINEGGVDFEHFPKTFAGNFEQEKKNTLPLEQQKKSPQKTTISTIINSRKRKYLEENNKLNQQQNNDVTTTSTTIVSCKKQKLTEQQEGHNSSIMVYFSVCSIKPHQIAIINPKKQVLYIDQDKIKFLLECNDCGLKDQRRELTWDGLQSQGQQCVNDNICTSCLLKKCDKQSFV